MDNRSKIQARDAGVVFAVRVIPRAKKTAIDGWMADGTLKIRLAAPPVEGKANQALVSYLAKILEIPTAQIKIITGETGRNKLILILGIDADKVQTKLGGDRRAD